MTLSVYAVSGAPRPWRVLAGLAFKHLEYDLNYLEASKGEHKAAEYLKINPRGTVPTLLAGELTMRDSIGILAWLDREYPDRPLFGKTAFEAGRIWQVVLETADYLRPAHNRVFFSIMAQGKPVANATSEEGKTKLNAAMVLKSECARLEKLLERGSFLCGDAPTAADAVAFPDIRLIQRAIETKPNDVAALGLNQLPKEFPKLDAWKSRIENLPGMDKTMPPHWEP